MLFYFIFQETIMIMIFYVIFQETDPFQLLKRKRIVKKTKH